MKQISLILLVIIVFYSCEDEMVNVPDYQPDRLIEVSHEVNSLGLVSHKYEYLGEDITDTYYYSPPKAYISKYKIQNSELKEIHFSFENTEKEYELTDSIRYFYSDSVVIENYYDYGEGHKEFYVIKNGEIASSSWSLDGSYKLIDYYYEWSGDNLIRIEEQFWYGIPLTANITEYIYEYSDIENPFYFSNIPRMMKEFNNPYNHNDELTELIPKCSKNFPLKLTIIKEGPLWDEPTVLRSYTFECKTFLDVNKPYEIKMGNANYFLTYEEL